MSRCIATVRSINSVKRVVDGRKSDRVNTGFEEGDSGNAGIGSGLRSDLVPFEDLIRHKRLRRRSEPERESHEHWCNFGGREPDSLACNRDAGADHLYAV